MVRSLRFALTLLVPLLMAAGAPQPSTSDNIGRLVRGVHHFQQGLFREQKELYEHLVRHGQQPETLFITCSDSRISPNELTHTKPGELFVIRNAGNLIPTWGQALRGLSGESATLQYAVEDLQIHDIIVCGHTDCGAMKALLNPSHELESQVLVSAWIAQAARLRELLNHWYPELSGAQRLNTAIEENVLIQVESIRRYPFVKKRLAEGKLVIHAWVYDIGAGRVFSYAPGGGQFVPIEEAYGKEKASRPAPLGDLPVPNTQGSAPR